MAGKLLVCLVLFCVVADFSQCKRFGSSSGRSSSSRFSRGRGRGSSSGSKPSSSWFSYGSSKPSQSSSSRFSSGSSKPSQSSSGSSAPKYPSSLFGLSGSGSSASKYPSSIFDLSGFGSSALKYPSSVSGLSGSGSSAPKYPSSLSGLSGFGSSAPKYPPSSGLSGGGSNSGFTWNLSPLPGSGSSKYPSSTGLSGSGSGSKYPSSTGLSGSGSSSKYPSSTGLSGSGSGSKYPSSTGLSGSGTGSKYPSSTGLSGSGAGSKYASSTGLSGTGTGSKYPSSTSWFGTGSGSKYPHSTGSSGSEIQKQNYYPSSPNTHHSSNNYDTHNYGHGSAAWPSHGYFSTPTYYNAPQHVYITEYRNSGSRYGDLLTGLALYNMGRSHSHHNHYYYNDDYYQRRYYTSGSSSYDKPKNEATCSLRVKEDNKVEVLKIPCEIVSTFTEGSKKLAPETFSQTVCVSNYTVINNTLPVTTTVSPVNITMPNNASIVKPGIELKPENSSISAANVTASKDNATSTPFNVTISFNATVSATTESNLFTINSTLSSVNAISTTTAASIILGNATSDINNITSTTAKPVNVPTYLNQFTTSNITVMNTTNCTVRTDPLAVKGPPVNASKMECEVDIFTKDSYILRSKVDCSTLLQYAKMPEPKKDKSAILPSRSKLKSWLATPPWWMSLFIAV